MSVKVSYVFPRVRDAALKYFNDALNECSVNANNMQETAKTLQPASDLPGVRFQIASMKVIKTMCSLIIKPYFNQ